MRYALIALWMLLCSLTPAFAQVSINFGVPGVSIGINLPVYPQLQRVPGYPVYYAPGLNSNYFFYDGMYWVYQGDNWYASSWYNGPWGIVDPMDVPLYVLRVPVRYYRHSPAYFQGWRANDPPRWGEHWGQSWVQRRSGWDQWNRRSAPAPAPLPTYQQQYSGNRYPQPSQQAVIQTRNYRYQPRDAVAQQQFQHYRAQAQSAQPQGAPPQRLQQSQQARPQQAAPPQQVQQPPQAQQRQQQSQQPRPQQAAPPQQVQQPQPAPRQRLQQSQQPKPQQAASPQQVQQPPQASRQRQQQTPQQATPQQQAQQAARQRQQQSQQPKPQQTGQPQQAPRPQAHEQAPPGKEQNKEQGPEKDNKGKGQDR